MDTNIGGFSRRERRKRSSQPRRNSEQRSRNQGRQPDSTAENAETAEKGREGKIIRGRIKGRIANLVLLLNPDGLAPQ
jgi:protein required for attachment to host cells